MSHKLNTNEIAVMQSLIARSISHNEIAYGIWTASLAQELYIEAEGSVVNGNVIEYWGTKHACSWRVHLKRGCECGRWSGNPCTSNKNTSVIVEYMPVSLRASHIAARNSGVYPYNGAERIRVTQECANRIIEADSDWSSIV